jgi:transcriptional regulator with XRE-family HTH domain
MPRLPRLRLAEEQRQRLEKWSRGGATPYRLVHRAKVVLLAAEGMSNRRIASKLGLNPITVARWRSRFLLLGTEGIRQDAPRLGSPPPVPDWLVRTVLRKTMFERPTSSARWSTRTLAREVGVSHSTIRRIWKAFDARPGRSRLAALARDSRYHRKSIDVVGVYLNPPQRAVAIALRDDEASPSTQGSVCHGRPGARANGHDRPWMDDLVTTLSLLDGGEPKGSAHRLLDPEFLSFLHSLQGRRKGREEIRLIAESPGAAPSASLTRWLRRHPGFHAQFEVGELPLHEIVVDWLRESPAPRRTEEPPASLEGLRTAVESWVRAASESPRPFAWTRN